MNPYNRDTLAEVRAWLITLSTVLLLTTASAAIYLLTDNVVSQKQCNVKESRHA